MNTNLLQNKKPHLLDRSFQELTQDFSKLKIPSYRVQQVCEWLLQKRAKSFGEMSNLPLETRGLLEQNYTLSKLRIHRTDKSNIDPTKKFHFKTQDNQTMSAVFLPHVGYQTLCISSQVGCAYACSFCASGLVKFERNLSAGEILDQIFLAEEATGEKIHNVLFMGMGEPLANFINVCTAIEWFTSKKGLSCSPERMTLSTTGLAPQIEMLAEKKFNMHLALSLHAPDDELRRKIMPVSSKFSIEKVLLACKKFQDLNKSDFTIEYILLGGVNDQVQHAKNLAELVKSFAFTRLPKVNLIPNNPVPEINYDRPQNLDVETFYKILKSYGFIVHTRKAQGQDIGAACGQLS